MCSNQSDDIKVCTALEGPLYRCAILLRSLSLHDYYCNIVVPGDSHGSSSTSRYDSVDFFVHHWDYKASRLLLSCDLADRYSRQFRWRAAGTTLKE